MTVFRISSQKHIGDLSGTGARIFGARWNSRGVALLYTAPTRALAMAEVAVHIPIGMLDADYAIAEIKIPDEAISIRIDPITLPGGWNAFPPPPYLAKIGDAVALARKALLLEVPSAVVQGDFNILLNPEHPMASGVTLLSTTPFTFDKRIVRF